MIIMMSRVIDKPIVYMAITKRFHTKSAIAKYFKSYDKNNLAFVLLCY